VPVLLNTVGAKEPLTLVLSPSNAKL
jgi:hypothetical protein